MHAQVHSLSEVAKVGDGILQQSTRLDRLDFHFLLAGFHPRQGEQIIGKARHAIGVLADNLQELPDSRVRWRNRIQQGLGIALDGGQGSTQLVGNVGDEVAPRFLDALNFGDVMQHGDRASAGHGSGGNAEHASGKERDRPGAAYLVE